MNLQIRVAPSVAIVFVPFCPWRSTLLEDFPVQYGSHSDGFEVELGKSSLGLVGY